MKQDSKIRCRLCGFDSNFIFKSKILDKYTIAYFKCPKCELIQTEEPFWLKEAYKNALVDADTGLLARNIKLSRITSSLIFFLFDKKKKFLDYAGGYGTLTRLLRDKGFDYYWYDPHAENIFARGFRSQKGSDYHLVSAFEYLEHLDYPLKEVQKIVTMFRPKNILFSTTLYKEPLDRNWWYFSYKSGQHIAFYSAKTLKYLANLLNLRLYTNNKNVHLFSERNLPVWKFKFITKLSVLTNLFVSLRMSSRTFSDHKIIRLRYYRGKSSD